MDGGREDVAYDATCVQFREAGLDGQLGRLSGGGGLRLCLGGHCCVGCVSGISFVNGGRW